MLKCYCDRCKKETTVKYVSLQIKMKGANNASTKHLCPICWGKVLDVMNKVQEEDTTSSEDDKIVHNSGPSELEQRFYATCYGVDAGKVCSLYKANWLPQDIAEEIGKDVSIVYTIIDMYDLYEEVPNTKECLLPATHTEVVRDDTKVEEDEEDKEHIEDVPYKNINTSKGPKCEILTAKPDKIDDFLKTVANRGRKDLIREILLDICTGLYNIRDLMAKYNVQYQYVHKYYTSYTLYCNKTVSRD